MSHTPSGWKYYLPDYDETVNDAEPIYISPWQIIHDAEDAAEHAAEDEWYNRDGWEGGIENEVTIVVVSPHGRESTFKVTREASIDHYVKKVEVD